MGVELPGASTAVKNLVGWKLKIRGERGAFNPVEEPTTNFNGQCLIRQYKRVA